ncbi:hypothetical protein [Achromobacter mucicolens]|uniref:Uncharacterized protein n=1 Tax=Achromobacter mucicolens TaxID=1389922 RepID=A0ABM8LKM9_9BURK|nr:hypothetical protein [Achromobacter mucicolens]CAB3917176.1 hypothetical protein LMG3415_05302 [Achromobacter mucicolens]
MKESSEGKICRVVRTDVGRLAGAPGAVVMRVEHLPLADVPPGEKPNVTVFILDQEQASTLDEQIMDSFARATTHSH